MDGSTPSAGLLPGLGAEKLRVNPLDRLVGVHDLEQPARLVVLDQRPRLALVDLEPILDHVLAIVGTLDQLRRLAVGMVVAAVAEFRLGAVDIEHLAALRARAPPGQPLEQRLRIDVHQHDGVDRLAELGEQLVEGAGLGHVARIAVEDEALRGVGPADPLADQAEHDLVGNELAGIHRGLGALAELGAAGHRITQQVAGGHLGDALVIAQSLGLRALA
jgi:hypothetical protein